MTLPGNLYCGDSTYSLRGYDITITPDFTSRTLSLDASIDIDNPNHIGSFDFGLSDRYTSVIVEADSSPTTIERAEGWITVHVTHPASSLRLKFHLEGTPGRSTDENRAVIADSSLFLLWSDRFYPIDFEKWAPVRISVLLPPGFQAIAPGRLVSSIRRAANTLCVFETSRPTAAFSVFADSRWHDEERVVNGVKFRTLLFPQSERFRDQIFTSSGDVLRFYSAELSPYPFDEFGFVEIDSIYARRAFPGFIGYSPRYLEKEFTTTGYDAHETALLWWDYTTRGSGPGNFQWTEGFGDYSEVMYANAVGKPISRTLQQFREDYLNTPSSADLLYNELRGDTPQKMIHGKYPWLMHLVRCVTGEKEFRAGLHRLFERYRYSTFTMDEFISTLEKGTGHSLEWWRKDWLERRGVPDISASGAFRKTGSGNQLAYTLNQRGNIFHMPVNMAITSDGRTRVERVLLSKSVETFLFSSINPPAKIRLDPDGCILMRPVPPLDVK